MADPETNGAASPEEQQQPQSLREIAESAYDTILDQADESEPSGQPRDALGRWAPRSQEGEAAATPPSPSETTQETDQEHPAPETGQAAQPPSNWSAEDREAFFSDDPNKMRAFILRRHSEMESDYQKRVQAATLSNQFVNAVAPVFQHPDMVRSLQGRTAAEAVQQWGSFHLRAIDPNPNTRIDLLFELADRMQLDPAVVFGRQAQVQAMAFTPEELANPAIKKFADHIGMLTSQLRANESVLQGFQRNQQEAVFNMRRAEIDQFAATKNQDGTLAYPYFDAVLPIMMEHFRQDPTKTMADCYKAAVEPFLGPMEAAAKAKYEQQQNLARAQVATRGNVRGMTSPVNKPAPPPGPRSIRQTLEEAADEVGFQG